MNYSSFQNKEIVLVPPNTIMQRCIKTKWPTFIRLVYNTQNQANEGYYINTVLKAFESLIPMDEKLYSYFGFHEKLDNTKIFTCKGNSLLILESQAESICKFLTNNAGLRINNMVLDFIRGENNIFWLVNVKSYELYENIYRIKQMRGIMTDKEILKDYKIRKEGAENSGIAYFNLK